MREWEFLRAEEVYIYPSANSDDGGDVNSEHNLSEITYKMVYKNYVVCHKGDIVYGREGEVVSAPLYVSVSSQGLPSELSIQPGVAVINGYLIRIDPIGGLYYYSVDSSHVTDLDDFILSSNEAYSLLYDQSGNKINYPPSYYEELGYSDLPRLYLTIKLLKNSTGNVRGDSYSRSGGTVTRKNKGIAISLLNEEELSDLNVPYLVIGEVYYKNGIWYADNPSDKYQFIDITMVFSDSGLTMNEWIVQQINQRLRRLDTITKMTLDSNGVYDVNIDASVKSGNFIVTRYTRQGNSLVEDEIGGEKTGNMVYSFTPLLNYDDTYSVDDIQKRTHPSSKSGETAQSSEENRIANDVDSRDDGAGCHKVWLGSVQPGYVINNSTGKDGYLTDNGNSRILARADHRHDRRYLLVANSWTSSSETQFIGTMVKFLEDIFNENNGTRVWYIKKNGDASFNNLVVSSLSINEDLTVNGNTELKGDINFSGSSKQFTVHGSSKFMNDTQFDESVNIDNDLSVVVSLTVNGDSYLKKVFAEYLSVSQGNTLYLLVDPANNTVAIEATSITFKGNSSFTGSVSITGDATIQGSTSTRSLQVQYNATVGGNLTVTGDITGARVFGAVWNDYAELYLKDDESEEIDPGTVICKIGGKNTYGVSLCNRFSRRLVVGVCTDSYGHLLGGDKDLSVEENLKKYIPVAMSGRVLVKVDPGVMINEGDLLSPSLSYIGRATPESSSPGSIIGKALESTDGHKDKILMQVFLS